MSATDPFAAPEEVVIETPPPRKATKATKKAAAKPAPEEGSGEDSTDG